MFTQPFCSVDFSLSFFFVLFAFVFVLFSFFFFFFRYTNNPRESLTEFYGARKDSEWGERALYHMIEIYLNPGTLSFSLLILFFLLPPSLIYRRFPPSLFFPFLRIFLSLLAFCKYLFIALSRCTPPIRVAPPISSPFLHLQTTRL